MKKHATAWGKILLKYGFGFGLLAWVISSYWGDNPETNAPGLKTLLQGEIAFGWLAAAAALIGTGVALQIFRWYLLVRVVDLPFSLRNAYRLGMVGLFYNTFLPGAVGGDLVKAYFIAQAHPERKTRAVATVAIDRAMGLFGLILFVAVLGGISWANDDPRLTGNVGLQKLVIWMGAIAATSVVVFLLLGLLPQSRVDRFAGRLKAVPVAGKALPELWYAVWMYRQRLKTIAIGVGLSAAAHFSMVFGFHFASQVFPAKNPEAEQATLAEHMVVAPIGFIVQALPVTPGGVGVGEAAFAGLYKLSGRPGERGVVARLAYRVGEWAYALLGLVIFLRMKAHHELPTEDDVDTPEPVEQPPRASPWRTGNAELG